MQSRYYIRWKLRSIAGPMGITDAMMAEHLGISPQSFSYKMKNGFSKSEMMALCTYLNIKREDVSDDELN